MGVYDGIDEENLGGASIDGALSSARSLLGNVGYFSDESKRNRETASVESEIRNSRVKSAKAGRDFFNKNKRMSAKDLEASGPTKTGKPLKLTDPYEVKIAELDKSTQSVVNSLESGLATGRANEIDSALKLEDSKVAREFRKTPEYKKSLEIKLETDKLTRRNLRDTAKELKKKLETARKFGSNKDAIQAEIDYLTAKSNLAELKSPERADIEEANRQAKKAKADNAKLVEMVKRQRLESSLDAKKRGFRTPEAAADYDRDILKFSKSLPITTDKDKKSTVLVDADPYRAEIAKLVIANDYEPSEVEGLISSLDIIDRISTSKNNTKVADQYIERYSSLMNEFVKDKNIPKLNNSLNALLINYRTKEKKRNELITEKQRRDAIELAVSDEAVENGLDYQLVLKDHGELTAKTLAFQYANGNKIRFNMDEAGAVSAIINDVTNDRTEKSLFMDDISYGDVIDDSRNVKAYDALSDSAKAFVDSAINSKISREGGYFRGNKKKSRDDIAKGIRNKDLSASSAKYLTDKISYDSTNLINPKMYSVDPEKYDKDDPLNGTITGTVQGTGGTVNSKINDDNSISFIIDGTEISSIDLAMSPKYMVDVFVSGGYNSASAPMNDSEYGRIMVSVRKKINKAAGLLDTRQGVASVNFAKKLARDIPAISSNKSSNDESAYINGIAALVDFALATGAASTPRGLPTEKTSKLKKADMQTVKYGPVVRKSFGNNVVKLTRIQGVDKAREMFAAEKERAGAMKERARNTIDMAKEEQAAELAKSLEYRRRLVNGTSSPSKGGK